MFLSQCFGEESYLSVMCVCAVDEIKWDGNRFLLEPLCIANNIENANKFVPKNDIIMFAFKSRDKD
jgi:hypothetical protein